MVDYLELSGNQLQNLDELRKLKKITALNIQLNSIDDVEQEIIKQLAAEMLPPIFSNESYYYNNGKSYKIYLGFAFQPQRINTESL